MSSSTEKNKIKIKQALLLFQGKDTENKERRAVCLCHCMDQGHAAKSDDTLWLQVWDSGGQRDVGEERLDG